MQQNVAGNTDGIGVNCYQHLVGKLLSIFGDRDPREVPLYTVGQAAHHVGVAPSTVRAWAVGQPYLESQGRTGRFERMIRAAQDEPARLSFNNLAELFMLVTLRRDHELDLTAIRNAVKNVRASTGSKHPLLTAKFETDGVRLYLEEAGRLLDVSSPGNQYVIPAAIRSGLRRIERRDDAVLRFYPFMDGSSDEKPVVIDPELSFGKPTMTGTGVAVSVLADFVKAGESPARVAREFGLDEKNVRAAVQWQQQQRAA